MAWTREGEAPDEVGELDFEIRLRSWGISLKGETTAPDPHRPSMQSGSLPRATDSLKHSSPVLMYSNPRCPQSQTYLNTTRKRSLEIFHTIPTMN